MNKNKEIEVKITWLPKRKFTYIKEKIEDCIGGKVLELMEIPRVHDYYEEEQNVVTCKLSLPQSLEKYRQILIERWCRQDFGHDQGWLSIKESKVFDAYTMLSDKEVNINSFAFGTIVGLNAFVGLYDTAEQNLDTSLEYKITQIKGDFEHDWKKILIYFIVAKRELNKKKEASAETHLLHKFEVKYSNIYRIVLNRVPSGKMMDVCLYLNYPIMMYMVEKPENPEERFYRNYTNVTPHTFYVRMPNFNHCSKSDIGMSNVLKFELPWERSQEIICRLANNCTNVDCFYSFLKKVKRPKSYPNPQISSDNFNCVYALKCILSRTRDVSVQIYLQNNLKAINEKLKKYVSENSTALELVLIEINAALERKCIVIFENALDTLYERYKTNKDDIFDGIDSNLVQVRRAILTPTRVVFLPSQLYFKCRFFRQFSAENALRISIRDDNFEKLSFSFRGEHSKFNKAIDVVKRELLNGFKIGKKHYKILGCSTSHLRDQGVMFYACENIGSILCKLGNFQEIKCVSKYMARMGQVFSQAVEAVHVDKSNTKKEDDIKVKCPKSGEDFEFSDGIGKISPALAKKVYQKLQISNEPSAMQIRYAGYKGMLVVWSDMEDKQIVFRESMDKFDSNCESLEILKVSKPRLVYLNRHFINILSHLGIRDNVFFNLQKVMMEKLLKSFIYEKYTRDMLKENSSFSIDYDGLYRFGIEMLFEPFFVSLLKAIFFKQLETLKEKTRIKIQPDKGRTMFGVLDETKQLEYGQVFVQYSKDVWVEEDRTPIILKGEVLVTKNPCMHPGDVRKFQAVDISDLHHIKDCIVFPAKGKRPHPNEMAGSDLDGDEYSVIWLEELIFACDNHPAMDFPKVKGNELEGEVQVADMVEFVCKFIKEYNLGMLANAHLVWADVESDGVLSTKCINIAKKYSKCLDFVKTGINERLSAEERINEYPDFLDKKIEKDSYRSTKILGQLYRCSKMVQLGLQEFIEFDNEHPSYRHYMLDPDLIYPGSEIYLKSAKRAYKKYKSKVESMLTQYGIETEAELLSGSICNMHKYMTESQELNDLQLIEVRVKMLIKEMRKDFIREFVKDEEYNDKTILDDLYGSENKEKVFQKASAWYQITYDEAQRDETDIKSRKYYFGLPWTVASILNTMKGDKSKVNRNISRRKQFEKQLQISLEKNFPDAFRNPIEDHSDLCGVIFSIMHTWINNEILKSSDFSDDYEVPDDLISELLQYVFQETERIKDNAKVISIPETLMTCLERLTCLMLEKSSLNSTEYAVSYICNNQFVGQLAFKILLNLVCSHNTECFQSINSHLKIEEKDVEATFRLQLNDDNLSTRFCRFKDEVTEFLKDWTKVKEIRYRPVQVSSGKWIAIITVKGNNHAVNCFQDLIIHEDFKSTIIDSIQDE